MLTNNQSERKARFVKVSNLLHTNQTIVDSDEPLKESLTEFDETIDLIEPANADKSADSTGTTLTKGEWKIKVAQFYEGICGQCAMFCTKPANNVKDLLPEFKFNARKIRYMQDDQILPFATRINGLITTKLIPIAAFSKYKVTAANLVTGLGHATTFHGMIGGTKTINAGKTAADQTIDNTLDSLDDQVEAMEFGMLKYKSSHLGFYNAFAAINKIDNLGGSKTGMGGDVTKDGQPVSGAIISSISLKKNATTNLLGRFELERIQAGLYEFTCVHPVHGTLTKVVKVKLGKMVEVDWEY